MRHELHTEITIETTPEVVWEMLTDLGRYGEWNPFITSSVGKPEVGEKLINVVKSPGGKAMTFKPTVTVADPVRTFEWVGRLGLPGIFDGRHRFDLYVLSDGGTKLVHSEHLKGMLVRVLRKSLDTKTKQGFVDMNVALKSRAEAAVSVSAQGTTSCF